MSQVIVVKLAIYTKSNDYKQKLVEIIGLRLSLTKIKTKTKITTTVCEMASFEKKM